MPRLFAAIFPPPAALDEIVAVQAEVREAMGDRVTWVPRHKLNVGVVQFNNDDDLDWIDATMRWGLEAVRLAPFDVMLDRVKTVHHRHSGGHRSVYLDAGASHTLVVLTARLNARSTTPPHLTLGRYQHRRDAPSIQFPAIKFQVDRVHLVRSVRAGDEAGYHVVREWPLTGARAANEGGADSHESTVRPASRS